MDRAEFDRFADEYESVHAANVAVSGERPEFFAAYKIERTRDMLSERAASIADVLDFGSGVGNSIPHFRRFFPASRITCADTSPRCIEVSRGRFPGKERYVEVLGRDLPLESASFDLVFSACVFHHIDGSEHARWLGELRRVTRPGGALVVFEHNPFNPLTVRAVNTCPFDENARLVSARALAKRVRAAGWLEPEIRYHLFFPRALAVLRPLEHRLAWLPVGAQYSLLARR
jgi:SAM-dependent methyltransferase